MPKKVAIFIDGAYLIYRIHALKNQIKKHDFKTHNTLLLNDINGFELSKYCQKHIDFNENYELYRVFYYDAAPLGDNGYHHPVSNQYRRFLEFHSYQTQLALHDSIKETPSFALWLGTLSWDKKKWFVSAEKLKHLFLEKLHCRILRNMMLNLASLKKGLI